MKRALPVLIPVLALAVGILFLLLRSGTGTAPSPPVNGPPGRDPAPLPSRVPDPADPADAPEPRADAPGSLRLFVHVGGRGQGEVRVTLTDDGSRTRIERETGPDGSALFENLPPVVYAVTARHRLYVPAIARFEVASGKTGDLTIELRRGGRLVGSVTDADGRPVAAARATLLKPDTREYLHPDLAATSGPDGTFAIDGIPVTRFGLAVNHPGSRPWSRLDLALPHPVGEVNVRVVLDAGTRIGGRVVDQAGVPVSGAAIVATNESAVVGRSGEDGRFEIGGLGHAPISLSVRAEGYGTVYVRSIEPGTRDLEVRLQRGGRIAGRVTAAPAPIAFAVVLTRWDAENGREQRVQTKTYINDHAGAFAMADVAPGTYWIDIEAEGYRAETRPQVTVQPGQTLDGLVFRMRVK